VTTSPIAPKTVEFSGLDGLRLRGDRWDVPNRKGTIVLQHGGGQTRHSWHAAGERFAAEGWSTISLDARGHGESEWAPDGRYSPTELVGDILAVIGELEDPPVLVGASMGGSASLVAVGENPGIARGLVLVDLVPKIEPAGARRIREFMLGAPDGFASLDEVAAAIQAYNPHRTRPPSKNGLLKNVRQREDGRWHWHWDPAFISPESGADEPTRNMGHGRLIEAARNVDVPMLLVRGKQSDVVSADGVRELLAACPRARFVDVTDAGHMVAGDDNDVFSDAVLEFLAEI